MSIISSFTVGKRKIYLSASAHAEFNHKSRTGTFKFIWLKPDLSHREELIKLNIVNPCLTIVEHNVFLVFIAA